jgi:glyoxylase-like metal-dependent hydrolase (beta-lactamase superfamily II)
MNRWQVGGVLVTRIVELETTGGTRFILPDASPEACAAMAWMQPHFANAAGKLHMSVQALVIDTGSRRIIVDTCIGNDKVREFPSWTHLQTPFLADLAAAGYPRETIDTVLCTHLHVDHVGWNTMLVDGRWVPTFPHARYLIGRREWAYWQSNDDEGTRRILADSVRPIFEAGLAHEVDDTIAVCDEVSLEPTPGHTPGHVSIRIRSHGETALISGDFVHHPCQMERMDWGSSADADHDQAVATRQRMFERCAGDDTLFIGTHFATPTAGRVRRRGAAYFFEVEAPAA